MSNPLVNFFEAAEVFAYALQWLFAAIIIAGLFYIGFIRVRRVAYWGYFNFLELISKIPFRNHTPSS